MFSSVFCQWSTTPDAMQQVSTWGWTPTICSDESGGAYVLWFAWFGHFPHIFLQHVDSEGYNSWDEPLNILSEADAEEDYMMIGDGFGNALVYFTEGTIADTVHPELIVFEKKAILRKIDSLGVDYWPGGVRVSLDSTHQSGGYDIVTDGEGGAIVIWSEEDSLWSPGPEPLKMQHINANGLRVWGDNGITIDSDRRYGNKPRLISDGFGGAIVMWDDLNFQRISAQGDSLWSNQVPNNFYYEWDRMKIVSDGTGGIIYCSRSWENNPYSVFVQKISNEGMFVWEGEGVEIASNLPMYRSNPNFLYQREDSVIMVYWRNQPEDSDSVNSYIQMIDNEGTLLLPDGGIESSSVMAESRTILGMIPSYDNTTLVIFEDNRDTSSFSLYAQKLSANGERMWSENDVLFSSDADFTRHQLVTDNAGGGILLGSKMPLYGTWINKISRNGVLGEVVQPSHVKIKNTPQNSVHIYSSPNPFNPTTIIEYDLPKQSEVSLMIYDITGRKVETLVSSPQSQGSYQVGWSGTDEAGRQVAGGMYFARLQAGANSMVVKMLYLR